MPGLICDCRLSTEDSIRRLAALTSHESSNAIATLHSSIENQSWHSSIAGSPQVLRPVDQPVLIADPSESTRIRGDEEANAPTVASARMASPKSGRLMHISLEGIPNFENHVLWSRQRSRWLGFSTGRRRSIAAVVNPVRADAVDDEPVGPFDVAQRHSATRIDWHCIQVSRNEVVE